MLDDNAINARSNEENGRESYRSHDAELDKKYIVQWTSPEENKYFFKNRYVSASRSVPRRTKQFIRYRISRSLNFDMLSIQNSSSETNSADGEKHLSRSAKIMRALNFNSSPTYYGRTKIKRSLNFNLTPSPKTFSRTGKNIRRASSLNFATSSPKLSKVLNYDDSPSSSANGSFVFAGSDSIDENQNETPSQQRIKARQSLNYSTPDTKFENKKSPELSSFTPYLRSNLKEKINNIVCVATTPNQSAKCKSRLKYSDDVLVGTPRNLLNDFHEDDNGRPTTPENLIRLVPESMSAIKRSHKKERSSRRSDRGEESTKRTASEANVEDVKATTIISPITTSFSQKNPKQLNSIGKPPKKRDNRKYDSSIYNRVAEDSLSDTGSIFDYTEEQERLLKEELDASDLASAYDGDLFEVEKHEISDARNDSMNLELEEDLRESKETEVSMEKIAVEEETGNGVKEVDGEVKSEDRLGARTPELNQVLPETSQKPMTPENRINYLQHVLQDSIKKSHKKIKEDRKKKLFSPKVLHREIEAVAQEQLIVEPNEQKEDQCNTVDMTVNDACVLQETIPTENTQRARTPDKINSSRLLLSQFSSVKKSHKKDKHNKILSRFKKRQEYFIRDLECPAEQRKPSSSEDETTDKSKEEEPSDVSLKEMTEEMGSLANICSDKLSPSKRKKSLDSSLDQNASNVSCGSELQDCDSEKEDFQIFTPLKRKKAGTAPVNKEYFSFYKVPSVGEDISEESLTDVNLTRCLTPIVSFRSNSMKSKDSVQTPGENDEAEGRENHSVETEPSRSGDRNTSGGRSTPRNMSTTELYPNVDSIKKSHKKNKRGNRLRKRRDLSNSFDGVQAKPGESPFRKSENLPLNSSDESIELCLRDDDDVLMENASKLSTDVDSNPQENNEDRRNENVEISNEETAPIKTPPNCLKTKSYITRIQNTSIKRSHKKVRDKKKHEITMDIHDLSDDGSIFGDEERLCSLELEKSSPGSKEQPGVLGKLGRMNS